LQNVERWGKLTAVVGYYLQKIFCEADGR